MSAEKVKQIKAILVAEREKLDKEKEAFEKRIEVLPAPPPALLPPQSCHAA